MIRSLNALTPEVRENMRGGKGAVTFRHFFTPEEFTASARLCASITLPPGAGIGPHVHETEDELYFITRGEGMLDDGQTQRRVRAGDAVLTGNGESHAIHNDGDTDLELIAVILCYGPKA